MNWNLHYQPASASKLPDHHLHTSWIWSFHSHLNNERPWSKLHATTVLIILHNVWRSTKTGHTCCHEPGCSAALLGVESNSSRANDHLLCLKQQAATRVLETATSEIIYASMLCSSHWVCFLHSCLATGMVTFQPGGWHDTLPFWESARCRFTCLKPNSIYPVLRGSASMSSVPVGSLKSGMHLLVIWIYLLFFLSHFSVCWRSRATHCQHKHICLSNSRGSF